MYKYLFKGKRKDNGEWIEGFLLKECNHSTCSWNLAIEYKTERSGIFAYEVAEVIPETVGQFTGLTDKNGKNIFEGNICRFREWSKGDMCWIGKVHYEHQQFVISGNKNKECANPFTLAMSRFTSENIEIIGDIYDNPELLEEVA